MAEAGIAAFGAAAGVAILMAVVAFILRQRRPHGPQMEALLDEQTEKVDTPESWKCYKIGLKNHHLIQISLQKISCNV